MNSQTIPQSLVPQPQPVRRLHQKQLLFHLKWVRLYPWCRSRTHGCHCHSQPVHPLLGEAWKPQHQTRQPDQASKVSSSLSVSGKLSSITSTLYTLDYNECFLQSRTWTLRWMRMAHWTSAWRNPRVKESGHQTHLHPRHLLNTMASPHPTPATPINKRSGRGLWTTPSQTDRKEEPEEVNVYQFEIYSHSLTSWLNHG